MKSYFSRLYLPIRQAALPACCATLLAFGAVPHASAAPPANDNYENAQVIPPGTSFSLSGTNLGATVESFETASGYPFAGVVNTVWYLWTPSISGFIGVTATRPSAYTPSIAIFRADGQPRTATYMQQSYNLYSFQQGVADTETGFRNVHVDAGQSYYICYGIAENSSGSFTAVGNVSPEPTFFDGETVLSDDVNYLAFSDGTPFGYYSYLSDARYIYHFDLGYEFVIDANDGNRGVYLYDFASETFFYTSPKFPFPYLYDFTLTTVLYYYPDTSDPGHYTANPRYFFDFATGKTISK